MAFDITRGAKVVPEPVNQKPAREPQAEPHALFRGVDIDGVLPGSHPFAKDAEWQRCLESVRGLYRWCEAFEKKHGRQPSIAEICGVERKAGLNALIEQPRGGK